VDTRVFEELYRDFQPELLRKLSSRFPRSVDLVEDGVQHAFTKLHVAEPVPDNPRGWLRTVARNYVIDRLREQGKIGGDETALEDQGTPVDATSGTAQLPSASALVRAIDLLTTRARKLIRGKHLEDKTYGTLARETGLGKASIGKKLWQARQRLKEAALRLMQR